jgi:hypothetical protein
VIEIVDDPGVLARPDLDPATLTLEGVAFGADAAVLVSRVRIIDASAAIVHRSIRRLGEEPEYYTVDDRRLTLDQVIGAAVEHGGMVYCPNHFSYKITAGSVAGFAVYGRGSGLLAHFDFLRTYEEFLSVFGTPDRAEESRIHGDLLGYSNYYWRARKQAYWSADDEDGSGLLSSVNIGDYPGNSGPHGTGADRQESPSAHR